MKRQWKRALMAMAGSILLVAETALPATCTWTGTWDVEPSSATDAIIIAPGNSNLSWSAALPATVASWTQQAGYTGTATFQTVYGATGFTNFTVTGDVTLSGGCWTHGANTTAETYRLCVSVGGAFLLTNATLGADGLGFAARKGPGAGASSFGGAHGGMAQGNSTTYNSGIYGSVVAPTNIGSGGGGAAGGGAIFLDVAETATIAPGGLMTANGRGVTGEGSGSGGSIYLKAGWLSGNGTIQANGGVLNWGAGSGGRVAIVVSGAGADFSAWTGVHSAYGGGGSFFSAAGTVYRKTASGVDDLIIDNNNIVPNAPLSTSLTNSWSPAVFSNVVIRRKGMLGVKAETTLDFNTFSPVTYGPTNSYIVVEDDADATYPSDWTVNGYTLFLPGISRVLTNLTIGTNGSLSHFSNSTTERYKLILSVAGNLTVLSNGTITADGRGFAATKGPGGGGASYGGSHGGTARGNSTIVLSNTYGSVVAPTNLGSGGGKGAGGGAIILNVAGTTTVAAAGSITANGLGQISDGSGSGGSIYLSTGWLAGNGTIRANGGSADWGAGGGGRIAVALTGSGADFDSWNGALAAYGGAVVYPAAAGTVYRTTSMDPASGTVLADNANAQTNWTFTGLPAATNSVENLSQTRWVTQNKARLGLVTNTAVLGLTMNTNSFLELAGKILTTRHLTVTGQAYRAGTYSAAGLGPLVSDSSGGSGAVVVRANGTIFVVR